MIHFYDEDHREKLLQCMQKENRISSDGRLDIYYLPAQAIYLKRNVHYIQELLPEQEVRHILKL